MKAVDGGDPARRSDESRVRVAVARNLNSPLFEGGGPFDVTVDDTLGTNNRVYNLQANDADTDVRGH